MILQIQAMIQRNLRINNQILKKFHIIQKNTSVLNNAKF